MINFEATSAVSAEDKDRGLELIISRVQPPIEGDSANFEYSLKYPGGKTRLYFGGDIFYSDGPANDELINVINFDAVTLDNLSDVKERFYANDSSYEFLKGMSEGMVSAFKLRYGLNASTTYIVTMYEKSLVDRGISIPQNESRLDNGDIVLAKLRVSID